GHPYLGVGVGDGFEEHQAALHLFGAFFHRHDGGVGFALDGSDDGVDFAGGGFRPLGESAYLVGDDGEPEAVLSGAGGFDGGVEGEQVGLVGDLVDQVEQCVDVVDLVGQGEGAFAGQGDVGLGLFEGVLGLGGLAGDVVDGVGDGCGGAGELLGGRGGLGDRGALLGGGRGQLVR